MSAGQIHRRPAQAAAREGPQGRPGYTAPLWLPGAHAQTIWPALIAPRLPVAYRRERWDTPDGDFIDVDWVDAPAPAGAPLLVLFHGLEGNSDSHYARALMAGARDRGWEAAVPHFRGCSGEPNRLARAYHSGDSDEIDWILRRFRALRPGEAPIHAAGVSLGGNALLKWLGEREEDAGRIVRAAAAVSAPQDLAAGAQALSRGFPLAYCTNFLKTLKVKSIEKLERFPGLYDPERVLASRTFFDFDEYVTAPLHGFTGCHDYWTRSSSRRFLAGIRVPTLVLNALNDPFVPAHALAGPHEASPAVRLDYPADGGHVGFVGGRFPGSMRWLSDHLMHFFDHG